ncbi:MAG: hypothetical protein Q3985_01285 [Eubacteriales bacterium]|nr:hypothetical protein [Eubacteriales bacterium]
MGRNLRTGDPCPCCGRPIKMTDPDALRLLGDMCDLLGLPERSREAKPKCGTCDYNGGIVLTCYPPLYPCAITGEAYAADHECELTVAEREARKRVH